MLEEAASGPSTSASSSAASGTTASRIAALQADSSAVERFSRDLLPLLMQVKGAAARRQALDMLKLHQNPDTRFS